MLPGLLAPVTQFARDVVASGYLVAISLICLIQYVYAMLRQSRHHLLTAQFRRQVHDLSDELLQLSREQMVARLENQILREFLTQSDSRRAVQLMLRRFVPNSADAFAVFWPVHDGGETPPQARGLSDESLRALPIGAELLAELQAGAPLLWEPPTTGKCPLYAALATGDRKKARLLCAALIADADGPVAVFLTTSLLPIAAPRQEQLAMTSRVLSSVAPYLRQTLVQERQANQLRCTRDMLALRAIVDSPSDQPIKVIEAFLLRLCQLVEGERIALYLLTRDHSAAPRPTVRCGIALQSGVSAAWEQHENRLAQQGVTCQQFTTYDPIELRSMAVESLIGSAATSPIVEDGTTTGVICISRRSPGEFSSHAQQLCSWAGEILAQTIQRALSIVAIERQAREDGLTHLANRRTFDARLQHEMARLQEGALVECALLLLDLDHFKSVNDRYGHQAGDEVLREAARRVREQVSRIRSSDRALPARYGGEEMAVLLPGVGIHGAQRIAEAIRAAINQTPVHFQGELIPVTVSAGVATAPWHARDAAELIAVADAALYQAKAQGRNRVVCPCDVLV